MSGAISAAEMASTRECDDRIVATKARTGSLTIIIYDVARQLGESELSMGLECNESAGGETIKS